MLAISQGPRIDVSVRVLGLDGKPVVSAAVAQVWVPKFPELTLPLIPMEPLYTNADGFAKGSVNQTYPIVLTAFDQTRHLGGFVTISAKDTKDAVIRLEPMRAVTVDYTVEGLSVPLKTPWVQIWLVVPDGRPNSHVARDAYVFPLSKQPIYLPPGSYRFLPGSENAQTHEQWFDVPAGEGTFRTPEFVLKATRVATLSGKPAPELHVVGAMNIGKKVSLADFKGKWVLIDFWGTWCSACRSEMPSLIEFYNGHKAMRSKFELLSLHDSTQKTVAAMKIEIARIVRGQWKGKQLPFPVLLDQAGKTVRAYGITGFPTRVLIDPQGRIVDGGNLETLRRQLGGWG